MLQLYSSTHYRVTWKYNMTRRQDKLPHQGPTAKLSYLQCWCTKYMTLSHRALTCNRARLFQRNKYSGLGILNSDLGNPQTLVQQNDCITQYALQWCHMSIMASQITDTSTLCLTSCSSQQQRYQISIRMSSSFSMNLIPIFFRCNWLLQGKELIECWTTSLHSVVTQAATDHQYLMVRPNRISTIMRPIIGCQAKPSLHWHSFNYPFLSSIKS